MNGRRLHWWLLNNQSQFCLRNSIKCSLLEAWRVSWGEALHACPVLTSPSEIQRWQLSKQRSWARWTFGLNPHCCSCTLTFYRTPFQSLGPPPSAPALPVRLSSVWPSLCGKTVLSTSFTIRYWLWAQLFIHLEGTVQFLGIHYHKSPQHVALNRCC